VIHDIVGMNGWHDIVCWNGWHKLNTPVSMMNVAKIVVFSNTFKI
jgi:hypothetical protein